MGYPIRGCPLPNALLARGSRAADKRACSLARREIVNVTTSLSADLSEHITAGSVGS